MAACGTHLAEYLINPTLVPSPSTRGNEARSIYRASRSPPSANDGASDSEDDDCIYNPFGNSSVTQRTPPALAGNRQLECDKESLLLVSKKGVATDSDSQYERERHNIQQGSELEMIIKLRKREQQQIQKCVESIAQMKETMLKHRNISTDIKTKVIELEEAIEFMQKYRKDWMSIETDLQRKPEVKDKASQASTENVKIHSLERAFEPYRVHDATPKRKDTAHTSVDQQNVEA
ncbi:hypothetical protein KM043_004801, partial [Ampulex compressa]